ncbi:hypothetical protein [Halobacteriovorax sp. RT-2-6]|uniref:hypothetical protein n=1 Tax=unclassified Halobacteriovorax TaxID=2639665 RepID=UPI00399B0BA3
MRNKNITEKSFLTNYYNIKITNLSLLNDFKLHLKFEDQVKVVNKLRTNDFRFLLSEISLLTNNKPRTLLTLPVTTPVTSTSTRQLAYLIHGILHQSETIKKFNKSRLKIESDISFGEFEEAFKECEKVVKKFGLSFWVIEKLYLISKHCRESKRLYKQIEKSVSSQQILLLDVALVIMRTTKQKKSNYKALIEDFESSIEIIGQKTSKQNQALAHSVLQLYFFPYRFSSEVDLNQALHMSEALTLIDRFVITQKVYKQILTSKERNFLSSLINNETFKETYSASSPNLLATQHDLNKFTSIIDSNMEVEIIKNALNKISKKNNSLSFIEYEALLLNWNLLKEKERGVASSLFFFQQLDKLLERESKRLTLFLRLDQLYFMFNNFEQSHIVNSLIESIIFPDNSDNIYNIIISNEETLFLENFYGVSNYYLHPILLKQLQAKTTDRDSPWSNYKRNELLYSTKDYSRIILQWKENILNHTQNTIYLEKLHSIYFWSLLAAEEMRGLVIFILSLYAKYNDRFDYYPIDKVINIFIEKGLKYKHEDISVMILYYIVCEEGNINFNSYTMYTFWDNFMNVNHLPSPEEIVKTPLLYLDNKDYLKIYFKKICIFDVINRSLLYNSDEEVFDLRTRILQILFKIDPDDLDSHKEEISILALSKVRSKLKREINDGRIYADIKNLSRELETYINYNYSSFVDPHSPTMSASILFLTEFEHSRSKGTFMKEIYAELDRYFIFSLIFDHIRSVYINSEMSGLNNYIGTRIRHNILSGEVRAPLKKHKVIIDKVDGHYPTQENIDKALVKMSKSNKSLFYKTLHNLYDQIQLTIDNFTDKILRVQTAKNKSGLVRLNFTDTEKKELMEDLVQNTNDQNSFLKKSLSYLVKKTEEDLQDIRNYYSEEFVKSLTQIYKQIMNHVTKHLAIEYSNQIETIFLHAETSFKQRLEDIESWFYFQGNNPASIYKLDEIVEYVITEEIMINPDLKIELIKNYVTPINNVSLNSEEAKAVNYIFENLISNFIRHGQTEDGVKRAIFSTRRSGNSIIFEFSNKSNESEDKKEIICKVKSDIANNNFDTENKNTGIKRIIRILIGTFNIDIKNINFGLSENCFTFSLAVNEERLYEYFSNRR